MPEFSKTNKKSRVKNIVSYFFGAMGATFKVGKMDYVFSISQPPILGGLLGVWGKWMKHAKYIYNIQDFNPEQVLAVGYTKSKFVTDVMMWLDKFSCKRSDLIITVGRDLVPSREIKIGKNCFIGCNSIILKGTVLGDGCVVGAGAVVCGKFEDNCVIAGNPARVIKRLEGNS